MSTSCWKQFERDAAQVFGGRRHWANSGGRVDFTGHVNGQSVAGSCKLVRVLSLEQMTQLLEEAGVDVLCVKRRRGAGCPSPMLIVFTAESYRRLHPRA